VLQRGVEVTDIVNMAAICVVDAQEDRPAQPAATGSGRKRTKSGG
jgi:hypothetical protein